MTHPTWFPDKSGISMKIVQMLIFLISEAKPKDEAAKPKGPIKGELHVPHTRGNILPCELPDFTLKGKCFQILWSLFLTLLLVLFK